jgi:hypothetical protein
MRLRFDDRELRLLRGAEQVRGAALAHMPRAEQLRSALNLAKVGHKLGHTEAGTSISLEETEVGLLLEALRYATEEVKSTAHDSDSQKTRRRDAVLAAFPELVERGGWRSFGLTRELESLSARLHTALNS